jgi:hypothetical protein
MIPPLKPPPSFPPGLPSWSGVTCDSRRVGDYARLQTGNMTIELYVSHAETARRGSLLKAPPPFPFPWGYAFDGGLWGSLSQGRSHTLLPKVKMLNSEGLPLSFCAPKQARVA